MVTACCRLSLGAQSSDQLPLPGWSAIGGWRQRLRESSVERWRAVKIEHVFERIGVLVPPCQVNVLNIVSLVLSPLFAIAHTQEPLLDQSQHGGVISDRMRDIAGLRKR